MKKSFRILYCEYYHCAESDFERRLFRQCLHRHARPLAGLMRRLNPDFFVEDTGFIREVATATSRGEVICELNRFFGRNMRDQNWVRKRLVVRISGKRVLRLFRMVFRAEKIARVRSEMKSAPPSSGASGVDFHDSADRVAEGTGG